MKKVNDPIRRVGLIANPEKVSCQPVLREAVRLVQASGRTVLADGSTAKLAQMPLTICENMVSLSQQADLLLVFGGDGTMLRVARETAGKKTPIVGINVGGLGFLTAIPSTLLAETLEQIWAGEYHLETRPLIAASSVTQERQINQEALNDFVIGRGAATRMIELEVKVDEEVLTRYRCDGLIVSSPTGSTAYSLSAGGAVVCPTAEVFTLTPICPHTLTNRSVIVSLKSCIHVKVLSLKLETIMTADGQVQTGLAAGDVVTIRRSRHSVRLLHPTGSSFFSTLRRKLSWSGSNI